MNKIMEKLTYVRLVNFIVNCGLLSDYQFGFRKGKLKTDAIFEVTLFSNNRFRNKSFVSFVFLDLKKALDSVSNEILLINYTGWALGKTQILS